MPGVFGKRPEALVEGAETSVYVPPVVLRALVPTPSVIGGTAPAVVTLPAVARFVVPSVSVSRTVTALAYLLEGSTVRASFAQGPTSSFLPHEFALSAGVIASISDWGNVRLRTWPDVIGGRYRLSQAELELSVTAAVQTVDATPAFATFVVPNITKGQPPVAVIGSPAAGFSVAVGQTVTFDPAGTYDPDGSWQGTWNFGDGSTHTGIMGNVASHVVQHAYVSAGPVTVTWTVTDEAGNVTVATRTGTVTAAVPVPTSLAVDPASFGLYVGQQQTLSGEVRDQFGQPMSGQVIGWESSNPAVATRSPSTGPETTVTGVAPGAVTITARTPPGGAILDTSAGTIADAPAGSYPNEPAGFTRMVEHSFDHLPGSPGGGTEYVIAGGGSWGMTNNNNRYSLASSPAAPQSPTSVLDVRYDAGMNAADDSPGIISVRFPECRELYVSYRYKVGGPLNTFENHATAAKLWGYIAYGKTGGRSNQFFMRAHGGGGVVSAGPYYLVADFTSEYSPTGSAEDYDQGGAGATGASQVVATRWQQMELYFRLSTVDVKDGVFKCWVDGVLTHNYATVGMRKSSVGATAGFYELHFDPVYGGTGYTKQRVDHNWFDHVYVSGILK